MAIEGQRMMSKTQHYRKITKPLLERKRRARMNHYLDELKDLIVETMEAQGEHVTKLEKADILEMTVQYLKTKKQLECRPDGGNINADKFRAGYTQAAYEVSKVFSTFPGIDAQFGTKLMQHLGYQLGDAKPQIGSPLQTGPLSARIPLEQGAPQMPSPAPSDQSDHCPVKDDQQGADVWRPW